MVTIQTVATITEDGTMTARVPGHVPTGEHRVVIVVDELPLRQTPSRFPNLATFRESLGAAVRSGNSIVEMRGDERS